MMVLSGKAGEDGAYVFAQIQPPAGGEALGSRRRVSLRAGHCLLAAKYLFQGGVWQSIERNAPEAFKSAIALNPTGRMGVPEKVAAGVVFISRPADSRSSGANLIIDGALTKPV